MKCLSFPLKHHQALGRGRLHNRLPELFCQNTTKIGRGTKFIQLLPAADGIGMWILQNRPPELSPPNTFVACNMNLQDGPTAGGIGMGLPYDGPLELPRPSTVGSNRSLPRTPGGNVLMMPQNNLPMFKWDIPLLIRCKRISTYACTHTHKHAGFFPENCWLLMSHVLSEAIIPFHSPFWNMCSLRHISQNPCWFEKIRHMKIFVFLRFVPHLCNLIHRHDILFFKLSSFISVQSCCSIMCVYNLTSTCTCAVISLHLCICAVVSLYSVSLQSYHIILYLCSLFASFCICTVVSIHSISVQHYRSSFCLVFVNNEAV